MRTRITEDALAQLAIDVLRGWTVQGCEFTAYDVTKAVRKRQPDLDIPHEPVRICVHLYMGALLSEGLYQASMKRFGGGRAAILYQAQPRDSWRDSIPLLSLDG
jgi:hypothetical protein